MAQSASEKGNSELDIEEVKMPSLDSKEKKEVEAVAEEDIENQPEQQGEPPNGLVEAFAKLQTDLEEAQNKYLYAMAETDNIKKRNFKERTELIKYQGESLARDLLEILDDLERISGVGSDASSEVILEGVQLVGSRMKAIFDRHSIKGEDSVGQKFDPSKHDALTMVNSSEVESGVILQELKRSFYYKDKLLRPAQVVVSNGTADEKSEEPDDVAD